MEEVPYFVGDESPAAAAASTPLAVAVPGTSADPVVLVLPCLRPGTGPPLTVVVEIVVAHSSFLGASPSIVSEDLPAVADGDQELGRARGDHLLLHLKTVEGSAEQKNRNPSHHVAEAVLTRSWSTARNLRSESSSGEPPRCRQRYPDLPFLGHSGHFPIAVRDWNSRNSFH